jgi:hypothetical protein
LVGGGGVIAGLVVNGWDCASSNRAHPEPTSNAAHSTTASRTGMLRDGPPSLMLARLRIAGRCAPRRPVHRAGVSQLGNGVDTLRNAPRQSLVPR